MKLSKAGENRIDGISFVASDGGDRTSSTTSHPQTEWVQRFRISGLILSNQEVMRDRNV